MGGGLVAITGKIEAVCMCVWVCVIGGRGGLATTKPTKCTSMIFSAHTQAGPINEDKSLGCTAQIMSVFVFFILSL